MVHHEIGLKNVEVSFKCDRVLLSLWFKLKKISTLKGRKDALQAEFLMAQKHPAMLLISISAANKHVSPSVGQTLLLGVLLGLMLGVLYALGREGWRNTAKCDS